MKTEKDYMKVLSLISKLEPIEFFGLMRLFNIQFLKEDQTPKDFNELMNDFTQVWLGLNRKQRRNLKIFLKRVKKEGQMNGDKEM